MTGQGNHRGRCKNDAKNRIKVSSTTIDRGKCWTYFYILTALLQLIPTLRSTWYSWRIPKSATAQWYRRATFPRFLWFLSLECRQHLTTSRCLGGSYTPAPDESSAHAFSAVPRVCRGRRSEQNYRAVGQYTRGTCVQFASLFIPESQICKSKLCFYIRSALTHRTIHRHTVYIV